MKLIACIYEDFAVVYDTDDVKLKESDVSTRNDVAEVPSGGPWIKRELTGYSHLNLHLAFEKDKRAVWMPKAEAIALIQHPEDEAVLHATVAALITVGFGEADARAFVGLPPLAEALEVVGKEN